MDITGCPEGYATDIAFQLRTATDPCNIPLAAYWSVFMFMILVRFGATVKQAKTWRNMNLKLGRRDRKPVAVSLSLAMVVLHVISIFCIGFNVANVYNGFSWMLYSLNLLPYFIQTSFIILRFVTLGERIIPLGRQLGVKAEDLGIASLRKFNRAGRFLVFLQIASATASSITLMIMSPIDPSHQDLDATIGLAFKAQFVFIATASANYQLLRCVLVVKSMQRRIQEMNISTSKDALANTKMSIRKMRGRMLFGFLAGLCGGMGFMLTAFHVLPRNIWWVYFYPGVTEALLCAILEFVVLPKRNPTGGRGSKSGDDDPAKATSSGANKVDPGIPSQPSSAVVAAPQLASQTGDEEESSRSGAVSSNANGPI